MDKENNTDTEIDLDTLDREELIRRLRIADADRKELHNTARGLESALAESRANDLAAMSWLCDARFASGDDGKRMLPDFIEYLKGLRADADRLNAVSTEYLKIDPFERPTGGDDADVGWRISQYHMGEPDCRVVAEVFDDNLRRALDAAMVNTADASDIPKVSLNSAS